MSREDGAAVAEMEHQLFSDAWSKKAVLETLEQKNTICLLAEKAGRTAGYLLAYTAAEEAEIARIAVVKELQRQGVARALLTELESVCRTEGIRKILLDVRSGNSAARALYENAGYREDGIRQRFYEEPQEDAVLMSRKSRTSKTSAARQRTGDRPADSCLENIAQRRQQFPLGISLPFRYTYIYSTKKNCLYRRKLYAPVWIEKNKRNQ